MQEIFSEVSIFNVIILQQHYFKILKAVDFCHKNGVVHRDVKDENLVVDMETMQIKLIDFGSASLLRTEPYRDFKGLKNL